MEKAKSMTLLIKTDSVYSCNKSLTQKNEEHFQKEANVSTMVFLTHMETNIEPVDFRVCKELSAVYDIFFTIQMLRYLTWH